MTIPILEVKNVTVDFSRGHGTPAVRDLSFTLDEGESLAIVGESGSGKSVSTMSLLHLLPDQTRVVTDGQALFRGQDIYAMDEARINALRGRDISMIFQEPMTSLNPVLTVGDQVAEVFRVHERLSRANARAQALEMLRRVRITDPERRLDQYPHQLSGGMRQRVMIAMALACRPAVMIADEPTTALDVTIQAEMLALLRELQDEFGMALILITHDMGVVAEVADRVVVMKRGEMIEEGPIRQVFGAPRTAYTRELLDAVPRLGEQPEALIAPLPASAKEPVLDVRDLSVRFDMRDGLLRRLTGRVHAVEDVSLSIQPGETLALIGESGSGKSTTGRAILKLDEPTEGFVTIDGERVDNLPRSGLRPVRRKAQMIFQDPYASLNPRRTAGAQIAGPMEIHGIGNARSRSARVGDLLERVGLDPAMATRFPVEFSGGQRQRLCIARALALEPKLIVADEAVSALDVAVQGQVLELMRSLQQELGLAYLFISHDMAVVERVSHRVAVMRSGRIVETGTTAEVLGAPQHAYTQRLLSAVPIADPDRARARIVARAEQTESPIKPLDHVPRPGVYDRISVSHTVLREQTELEGAA